ncbi:MAG: hypothetical protein PUA71_10565 [Eubacteriales bacterium]|nr:hypothetical protein [Eubacteriales bacterium]
MYIVTNEDKGAVNLRFWRGNETILWNCSICLSIEEYKKGNDCIKINGWDENSILVKTDLTQADSDGDGLSDMEDIEFGFDPMLPDTDYNGILDGDEKRNQIKEIEINNVENTQVKKISVEMKIGGNIEKKVEIKNVYGDDLLSSNIVGLIGVPVDIKLNEEFEEATLTFYYDKNKLGNTKESDLAVLWYDEENCKSDRW